MKEDQFIKINSAKWKELENFSAFIDKKGIKSLQSQEVRRFLHTFRLCSHHLAYARTHYPQSSVVEYLNSLVGKSHNHVYAVQKIAPGHIFKYILLGFPKHLKQYRWYVASSFIFFALGTLISLLMVLYNPDNAGIFLPPNIVEGVKSGQAGGGQWNYPLMSSYIMYNNISVSLRAFVFGITLGLGTIYVLFFNGAILGSLTSLEYIYGKPLHYWSLILPHGVIELTAVFISGAAGLLIARNLLLPGEYTRRHAVINGAKKAVPLMVGVIFMLVIAGIIEGFFTPLNIAEVTKLAFAAVTAIALAVYFLVPYIVRKDQ